MATKPLKKAVSWLKVNIFSGYKTARKKAIKKPVDKKKYAKKEKKAFANKILSKVKLLQTFKSILLFLVIKALNNAEGIFLLLYLWNTTW